VIAAHLLPFWGYKTAGQCLCPLFVCPDLAPTNAVPKDLSMIIASLLDTDLYKFTMQQVVFHHFPAATAEYTFQCRSQGIDLRPYADEISAEIDHFCRLALSEDELMFLGGIRYLHPSYVDSLRRFRLDRANVQITTDGAFGLRISGNWYQTILFEVPLLAIINEVYFRNMHPWSEKLEAEGLRRLREKCRQVRDANLPEFSLVEFGTRRRYGAAWQTQALDTLMLEVPGFMGGTSNVGQARRLSLPPFGTMAHEFLQAFQAFAPLPDFQKQAFETWMQEYRGDLGIALSDIVGMNAFFRDFDRLFSKAYDGARHDSGDPVEWGERLIAHYQAFGIDPRAKFAVFSDGLDMPRALALSRHFAGRIRTSFGVGTNLTNDLGFPALNIVLKMTRCCGQPVAKLSDSEGKLMASDPVFTSYLRQTFQIPAPIASAAPSAPKKPGGKAAL